MFSFLNAEKDSPLGVCALFWFGRCHLLDIPKISPTAPAKPGGAMRSMGLRRDLSPWLQALAPAPRPQCSWWSRCVTWWCGCPTKRSCCLVVDHLPGGAGAVDAMLTHPGSQRGGSARRRQGNERTGGDFLCPDLHSVCLAIPISEARTLARLLTPSTPVAAGVQCMRPGLARCQVQGPARWYRKQRGRTRL